MKIKYLGLIVIFFVIGCNTKEKQTEEDYNIIETNHFIIKSKFDFSKSLVLVENHLPDEIISKDSIAFIELLGNKPEGEVFLVLQIFDEKFTYNKLKLKEIDNEVVQQLGVEPYVYFDTIINSNKIELKELKVISDYTNLTANILKGKNCYPLTLISEDKNYEKNKNNFFEVLQGISIKD